MILEVREVKKLLKMMVHKSLEILLVLKEVKA